MADGARRRARIGDACYLAGGAALVASAFVRWIARGPGSGLRGHALVDALVRLGRTVPALSSARLTLAWYLVPLLGAASWVAFGVVGRRARSARIVAFVSLVVALVTAAAFWHLAGAARLSRGPELAVAGGVLLALGALVPGADTRSDARPAARPELAVPSPAPLG